jgi:hypothetical protein
VKFLFCIKSQRMWKFIHLDPLKYQFLVINSQILSMGSIYNDDILKINLYTILINNDSQVFNILNHKGTLTKVSLEVLS